jgi:hypothetical protein
MLKEERLLPLYTVFMSLSTVLSLKPSKSSIKLVSRMWKLAVNLEPVCDLFVLRLFDFSISKIDIG